MTTGETIAAVVAVVGVVGVLVRIGMDRKAIDMSLAVERAHREDIERRLDALERKADEKP